MKKILSMFILSMIFPCTAFAGTGYIPIWQHGFGTTFYNSVINDDVTSITVTVRLIDVPSSSTYSTSTTIGAKDVWMFSSPINGYGWGYIESTSSTPSTYGSGEIVSTVAGKLTGLSVPNLAEGFSGKAYIPIWQHGLGSTYFNAMVNADKVPITGEIHLIDIASSTTYTYSETISPDDIWMFDTAGVMSSSGFGWGFVTSTGAAGTTYAWGAIHTTLSGKLIGLTVIIPETGF